MTQPREDLDFLQEALLARDRCQLGRQDLDSDSAIMPQVLGKVDGSHTASSDLSIDAVPFREWPVQSKGHVAGRESLTGLIQITVTVATGEGSK